MAPQGGGSTAARGPVKRKRKPNYTLHGSAGQLEQTLFVRRIARKKTTCEINPRVLSLSRYYRCANRTIFHVTWSPPPSHSGEQFAFIKKYSSTDRDNPESMYNAAQLIRFIANAFRVSPRPSSYNSFGTRDITGISTVQSPLLAREYLSTPCRIPPMHANDLEVSTKEGRRIPSVSPQSTFCHWFIYIGPSHQRGETYPNTSARANHDTHTHTHT